MCVPRVADWVNGERGLHGRIVHAVHARHVPASSGQEHLEWRNTTNDLKLNASLAGKGIVRASAQLNVINTEEQKYTLLDEQK